MRSFILLTIFSTLVSCPGAWAAVPSTERLSARADLTDKLIGSNGFVSPSFIVTNVCQFQHATFVAIPDFPVTSNPYVRVKWEMGDGTIYNLNLPPGPPPATFNWMHTLHRYQLPGNYTVKMTLYFPDNTSRSFSNSITANPQPERPATTRKIEMCIGVASSPLTATPAAGNSILWYAEGPTGVYKLPGAPTPSTAAGSISQYRVTQITPLGCESYEDTVTVTVTTIPNAPVVASPVKYCQGATAVSLQSAVTIPAGTSIKWYESNDPASSVLSTAPLPGTTAGDVPGRNYYASLVSLTGCGEGPRSAISVVIHPKPTAPAAPAVNACKDATGVYLPTLTPISGHILHWWGTDATGGSWTYTARVPSTASVGTVTYYVSHWEQVTGCESDRTPIPVTTHPIPTAVMGSGATLCQNASAPLLKFSGGNGTAPYRFAYRIDGGAIQDIQTAGSASEISLPIATGITGSKTYELLGVLDANTCGQIQTGQAVFQVKANPDANISGNAEACAGATAPTIQLSASNGKTPYTFTYQINGGAAVTMSTAAGSSGLQVAAPTGTSGDFIYRLLRVSYADGVTCSTDIGTEVKVKVNPVPTATLMISGEPSNLLKICQASNTAALKFEASGGQEPYTLTYRLNGGAIQSIALPTGSPMQTQSVPTVTPGIYRFELAGVSDAKGCQRSLSAAATIEVLPIPDATASGTSDICLNGSGSSLSFTGSGGKAPYTFTWQVDGGPDQSAKSPAGSTVLSLIPPTASAGTLTYRLTRVAYNDGPTCSRDLSVSRSVKIHAPPPLPQTTDAAFCQGITGASLPAVTAATGHTLRWYGTSASGGTPAANPPSPSVSAAGSQTFYVSQAENTLGCESDRAQIKVTVHALPTAAISSPSGISSPILLCQDAPSGTIRFTGDVGLPPYRFTYRIDNGNELNAQGTLTDPEPSVSVPTGTPGSYRYELSAVEDSRGCKQTQTGSITYGIRATPEGIIEGTTTICKDAAAPTVLLTGSRGTNPYQFVYRLNGATPQTVTTDLGKDTTGIRPPSQSPGIYMYELLQVSYTNGITCSKNLSGTAMITINTTPQGQLSGPAQLVEKCQYAPATDITLQGSGGKAPYRLEYEVNGTVKTATGQPAYIARQEAGLQGLFSYRLTSIKDANGCAGPVSGTADIRIWPAPVVDAGPDQWMLEGESVILKGKASNGNGLQYAWTPSTTLNDPTLITPTAMPLTSTRYLLRVTTDQRCSDTSSAMVNVLLTPVIPNTFTPNGDGYNDRWEIRHLDKYPGARVEIFNTMGSLVFRSTGYTQAWDGTQGGKSLPAGTYYYVVDPRNGREKKAGYVTILR